MTNKDLTNSDNMTSVKQASKQASKGILSF